MAEEGTITTRGLIDADLGPLRRFTGILDSMPKENRTWGEGEAARPYTQVKLNFKDIDVKEAVEPYHFPIATLTMNQSNRKKSRWGVLSDGTPKDRTIGFNNVADQQYTAEQLEPSNANFIKASDRMDIGNCIGKRLGMVLADSVDGRPESPELYDARVTDEAHPKGQDVPTPAWTVYEIEGVGVAGGQGVSAMDLAIDKADGKTLAEFNKAALDNPVIRADPMLLQSISKPPTATDSFINTMIAAAKLTQDTSGVLHKVA